MLHVGLRYANPTYTVVHDVQLSTAWAGPPLPCRLPLSIMAPVYNVTHVPGLSRAGESGREGGLEAPGDLKLEALGRGLLAGLVLAGAFYVQRQA